MADYLKIDALVGLTLTAVEGMSKGSDEITFTSRDGRKFRMWHSQDCCEHVAVEDVAGEPEWLIGTPILKAEETSNSDNKPDDYSESWTWTFYTIATIKGYVTLRWLGESNGYYGESVDFCEVSNV